MGSAEAAEAQGGRERHLAMRRMFLALACGIVASLSCNNPPPPTLFGKCQKGTGGGGVQQWDCATLVRDEQSGQEVRFQLDGYGSTEPEAVTSIAVQFPQVVGGSTYVFVSANCAPTSYDMICELGGAPSYVYTGGTGGALGYGGLYGSGGDPNFGTSVGGSVGIGGSP